MLQDVIAYVGHQVHVVRRREVPALMNWLGRNLRGQRILDVAGGDGYWAGQLRKRGATAVNIDLAEDKLRRGNRLSGSPHNVLGDALRLPFADATFDGVMSVCAIEHFADGREALAEMSRVLRPGGQLALSADALTQSERWPDLDAGHRRRYHVVRTYNRAQLTELLAEQGLALRSSRYIFRSVRAQRLYLLLSQWRVAWNAAFPLLPLVATADARTDDDGGSILLLVAVKADKPQRSAPQRARARVASPAPERSLTH